MEEINKYKIFKGLKLDQVFIENINFLYIFKDDSYNINMIIVTKDDETFVFGCNRYGVLGFGHSNEVKTLIQNEDLSKKRIIDFKNSGCHTIARTTDGKVYCWGQNDYGVLGNGREDKETHKPELNQYLSDKNIVDICCGTAHSLVLTIEGQVYSWGWNNWGQIGNGKYQIVSIPYHVKIFNGEKVKTIACGFNYSMALTENGNVFSWGLNDFGQLGFKKLKELDSINEPKLVEINEIFEKISCGPEHSLLLSRDGDIYVFGWNKFGQLGDEAIEELSETPLKLKNENKFIDIASHYRYSISMALSKEGIIFIWGRCGEVIKIPIETKYISFHEIFAHYFQTTYKTMSIENKLDIERIFKQFAGSEIADPLKLQSSDPVMPQQNDVTSQTKYKQEFKEIEMIGSGGFGDVFKVFNLFDKQNYAMKKILLSRLPDEFKEKCSKEYKLMAKLQSDHVVQYKNSWIENNEILFIQMELCLSTLKEILTKKRNEFQRNEFQPMSRLEYYVSSELFKEILKAVNFLHRLNIIHRDLKPTNILITNGINGRFVKLADFGLAVDHKFDEQTHTQGLGTIKYTAPEVLRGKIYDLKADIYSLGYITQQVFDIDIDSFSDVTMTDTLINGKYMIIYKIIIEMMSVMKNSRPSCDQILREKSLWALDMNEIEIEKNQFLLNEQSIEENFHKFFIKTKLRFR